MTMEKQDIRSVLDALPEDEIVRLTAEKEDYLLTAVMEELDAMGEGQLVCGSVGDPSFLVTEQPPLTPWPCHTPTQKEIEDAQTEGIGERVQEEGVMKNEDIQMVYSTVHGWA